MQYDFVCDECGKTMTVSAPMKDDPERARSIEYHLVEDVHGPMRRVYGTAIPQQIVMLGMSDYIEKAYNGHEAVPQLSIKKVRAIVDSQMKTAHRGRANRRNYGDRR